MLVAQPLGHVPVHNALGQPFDDGRLADARLPDQHGVVLGPSRQHLHHPADLLVPADHRVDLALASHVRQVAGEPLQRLVLLLGLLVGHAVRAAHALERRQEHPTVHARGSQQLPGGRALLVYQSQEQVLGRHVRVAQPLCLFIGAVEHAADLS